MGMRRTYRRPRCLKGRTHCWTMGAAMKINEAGTLVSAEGRGQHLKGRCHVCGKVKMFHPRPGSVPTRESLKVGRRRVARVLARQVA